MPSASDHRDAARSEARERPARCAILTISDTRTQETDVSGKRISEIVTEHGHEVAARAIVRDDPFAIRARLDESLNNPGIDVILATGGTGISKRDNTIDIVRELLTAELDGFGELFRALSYEEVGSAAMLSRAVGGLVARSNDTGGDTFIFAMPGSVNAVETAMKLIAPELAHLTWERRK